MDSGKYENFGANIARLRVEKGFTQAALAHWLGVTHQAVSQWECGDTMPDILLLPKLAAELGISLDALFGINNSKTSVDIELEDFPKDDEKLRAVVFIGKKMVKSQLIKRDQEDIQKLVFEYNGPALNVESQMSLHCGQVDGNAAAGHSLTCTGDIKANAAAGHSIACSSIGQNANAGHSINCRGGVGGNVTGGHGVKCGSVNGSVRAGHNAHVNGSVGGSVHSHS